MQISPNEIESIEDAGILDGSPVKLLRTKGGFWIATGKQKGKMREEALAAGSHPAIVKFNLAKQYMSFQPIMMKSELANDPSVVQKQNTYLTDDMKKSGHDIYSIQNGVSIEFQLTKHDVKIGHVKANRENGGILVTEMNIPKEFSHAMAGAVTELGIALGVDKIGIKG